LQPVREPAKLLSMNRFDIYRTTTGEWSVLDTDTGESIPPRGYEEAREVAQQLNTFPWAVEMYAWNQPNDMPEEWEDEGPEDINFPETMRPEIGEARQLATGLAMLGMNDAATTILNLIKLVEED
jgi:hypothetical protein